MPTNILVTILITFIASLCHSKKETLIYGGKNVTDIAEYPHALYILFSCPGKTGTWMCGGTVLTQNILLTAAHCTNIHCQMRIEAVAGSEVIDADKSIIRSIQLYYRHKYFDEDGPTLRNDIALLAVKMPLPFGRNVKRVVVALRVPKNAKMLSVAGWGRTSAKSTQISKRLKYVFQFLNSDTGCLKRLGEPLWPGQMCGENNVRDYPSVYDSGCGLMTKSGQQVGLVSYNMPSRPEVTVYTNVSHFYSWITKHARKLYCKVSKLRVRLNKDDYYGEDPNVEEVD